MTAIPIAFRSNVSKYAFSGEALLLNAYAEQQGPDAKASLALLPSYGLTLERAVTDTPCRGTIYLDDLDVIYSVHSTSVYKVPATGSAARVGTIPGNDIVQLSRNQAVNTQISIHCAAGEFYIENDVVKRVTDTDLPAAKSQDHLGGYTIYGIEDRRFFISSINECQTVSGTDFATAEQSADPLVRVKADGDLFIFKRKQVEQWRNTGKASFPFEPIGVPIKHGLMAPEAVTAFDNTLLFVGDDGVVYRITGTGAVARVSTHYVERLIANEPSQNTIVAFSHAAEGHLFATFTGSSFSVSYDAATDFWHTRRSYELENWRARFPVRAWGKTIVGDAISGNLYYLADNVFTEDDGAVVWGVDLPTFHVFPNGATVDAVYLDVATGVGTISGQGSSPNLMLSWSTDDGRTYKGHRQLSLGARGKTVRLATYRLGRFGPHGIKFRIRVSDPVIRSLIAADVRARPLKK